MLKVLGFALYGEIAASNRVRLRQYLLPMQNHGINIYLQSLLIDAYIKSRFENRSLPFFKLALSLLSRIKRLLFSKDFDIAIVHCELLPLFPHWLERLLLRKPYIFDFDDAFYLRYRTGKLHWLQYFYGAKIDKSISRAAAVTAGNAYLADYAKRLNRNTVLLPSVVDTDYYVPIKKAKETTIFTIGWIGSPTTSVYLDQIIEPLTCLGREGQVHFIVIGAKCPKISGIQVTENDWNFSSEISLINSFDVGIMPLVDDEWSRGKCAYKLVQYMACGVPVVASRVGANIDVVTPDCGFLATDSEDWILALRKIRDRPNLRHSMGLAARKHVVENYSLARNTLILKKVILSVTNVEKRKHKF